MGEQSALLRLEKIKAACQPTRVSRTVDTDVVVLTVSFARRLGFAATLDDRTAHCTKHNALQMRWMSAGCGNCLGILGVDLGG